MGKEDFSEFFKFLRNFNPSWAIAVLILSILAYRSPAILKEIFTGMREHAKVRAEIRMKQKKLTNEILQKKGRATARVRKAPES